MFYSKYTTNHLAADDNSGTGFRDDDYNDQVLNQPHMHVQSQVSRPPGDQACPSQSCIPEPEDVVTIHRQCNHAPRLPSNSQLLAARQQQTFSTHQAANGTPNNSDGQDCLTTNHGGNQAQDHPTVSSTNCSENQDHPTTSNNHGDNQDCPTVLSSNHGENQDHPTIPPTNHGNNQDRTTVSFTGRNNGQECRATSSTNSLAGRSMECSEPWQLQYYDLLTCDVIERVKQFSHCDTASINLFPVRAEFNSTALEYVNEAIAECQSCGLIISEGRCFDIIAAALV